ncbi:MAG TPA: hypothetical protein VFX83_11205, partial [Azonexus sp.]|nr:hypothetical protein [Azonexus sp.]
MVIFMAARRKSKLADTKPYLPSAFSDTSGRSTRLATYQKFLIDLAARGEDTDGRADSELSGKARRRHESPTRRRSNPMNTANQAADLNRRFAIADCLS